MAPSKRKSELYINEQYCKRCRICIEFCPDDVFEDRDGLPVIKDITRCSGCLLCELLCPDFAIEVHVKKPEKKKEAAGGAAAQR